MDIKEQIEGPIPQSAISNRIIRSGLLKPRTPYWKVVELADQILAIKVEEDDVCPDCGHEGCPMKKWGRTLKQVLEEP